MIMRILVVRCEEAAAGTCVCRPSQASRNLQAWKFRGYKSYRQTIQLTWHPALLLKSGIKHQI